MWPFAAKARERLRACVILTWKYALFFLILLYLIGVSRGSKEHPRVTKAGRRAKPDADAGALNQVDMWRRPQAVFVTTLQYAPQ